MNDTAGHGSELAGVPVSYTHLDVYKRQSYTTPATAASDNGAKFDVTVSNSTSSVTSNVATLSVNPSTSPSPSASSNVDVTTYHYDNLRSGQNVNETTLTTANVSEAKFGLLGSFAVDGKVDAQPLYLSNVAIPNLGNKNVLYVVTEHDSVFAFDADSVNGSTTAFLWMKSLLQASETSSAVSYTHLDVYKRQVHN